MEEEEEEEVVVVEERKEFGVEIGEFGRVDSEGEGQARQGKAMTEVRNGAYKEKNALGSCHMAR